MRRLIKQVLLLAAAICLFATPVEAKTAPARINKKAVTITAGKSTRLSVKNAKKVKWKSGNKKVATVNQKGVVHAKKKGKAKITATVGKRKYTCTVTVKPARRAPKSVRLNKKKATIKVGKSLRLKASVSPSNATGKALKWSSSNKKVATVTKKGVVKAKKAGKTTITVRTRNGKKASCRVTVKKAKPKQNKRPKSKIKGMQISGVPKSLKQGKKVKLKVGFIPKKAAQPVRWASSNRAVATVSKDGVVTGVSKGTAAIKATATDGSGFMVSATVKVVKAKNKGKKPNTSGNKAAKPAAGDKEAVGIEASCRLNSVEYGHRFKPSEFNVKAVYDDGSKAAAYFVLESSYANGYYDITVTSGGFKKDLKVRASNAPGA